MNEQAIDREREERLQWVLEYMGFKVEATDTMSRHDFLLHWNGKPALLAEYKYRAKMYNTHLVSKTKIDGLITRASALGVRPVFITSYETETPYWRWDCHGRCEVETFRRVLVDPNRPDPDKSEPCYAIPRDQFHMV